MNEDCVFCKIVSGEISSEKLFENENFIIIRDVNPVTDGHCLVIPKKHFDSFLDLDSKLYEDFLKITRNFVEGLNENFNLIINNGENAGQVVKHLHMHVVPRTKDDEFRW